MKRWGIFILIILGIAFFTNPDFEKHKIKLQAKYEEQNPLTGFFGAGKVFTNFVDYHDKYIFSYTTEKIKNNPVSFGFFGMVWVADLDIDKINLDDLKK